MKYLNGMFHYQYIIWFEIPVNVSQRMDVHQALTDLMCVISRLSDRHVILRRVFGALGRTLVGLNDLFQVVFTVFHHQSHMNSVRLLLAITTIESDYVWTL